MNAARRYHLPGEHDQLDHTPKSLRGQGGAADAETKHRRQFIAGAKAAQAEEQKLIGLTDHEEMRVFDSRGRLIGTGRGDQNTVNVPESALGKLKNSTITHNHPGGDAFSRTDVALAIGHNLREMRAVAADGSFVYILRRPPTRWPSIPTMEAAYREADSAAFGKIMDKVMAKEILAEEADKMHRHIVWTTVAEKLKLDYQRVRLKRAA